MKTRMIVPALLSAAMLSAPVLAAGTDKAGHATPTMERAAAVNSAERCTALQKQFDAVIKKHEKAKKKAEEAETMRRDGGKLCAAGNSDQGIAKLETALKHIGVKPKA